jgi:hypothetical protein
MHGLCAQAWGRTADPHHGNKRKQTLHTTPNPFWLCFKQSINSLLRRELRACSSELRRAAQSEAGGGEGLSLGLRERSVLNAARCA